MAFCFKGSTAGGRSQEVDVSSLSEGAPFMSRKTCFLISSKATAQPGPRTLHRAGSLAVRALGLCRQGGNLSMCP
jgi:hypothetical protein